MASTTFTDYSTKIVASWANDVNSNTYSVFNVKHTDYGAVGDGVTDDTSAIQAAITAAENAGGGTIFFPDGIYKITSGFTITTADIAIVGMANGYNALCNIRLDPAADTTIFHFNLTYDACRISNINIDTDGTNTTYSITAIKLTDVRSCELYKVNVYRCWGQDSIALHILGREMVSVRKCGLHANVPIRISLDPNYATGVDHLYIRDSQINATGGATDTAPNSLTWADILIDSDARITGVYIEGCAIVKGQYGIHYDRGSEDYSGSVSNALHIKDSRLEQLQSSGYCIYTDGNANARLRNLILTNVTHSDDSAEGIYARFVNSLTLNSCYLNCDTSGDVMDVDDVEIIEWLNVFTDTGSSNNLSSDTILTKKGPHYSGYNLPRTATWQLRTGSDQESERPIGLFSAHKWAWAGELADDGSIIVPLADNRDVEIGEARVSAMATSGRPSGATSEIAEYGHFLLHRSTASGTNGITKLTDSTTNVAVSNTDGSLSIDSSGSTPLDQTMRLRNRLGDACYFVIEVTYYRSSET